MKRIASLAALATLVFGVGISQAMACLPHCELHLSRLSPLLGRSLPPDQHGERITATQDTTDDLDQTSEEEIVTYVFDEMLMLEAAGTGFGGFATTEPPLTVGCGG